MNRRSFLKGLGLTLIGLQIPIAAARPYFLKDPRTWRQRLPMPERLEDLAPAIERLFPGVVLNSDRAYEEYLVGTNTRAPDLERDQEFQLYGFGLAPVKGEGQAIQYDYGARDAIKIQRCIHTTFALGYILDTDQARNAHMERALIGCHYQTMLVIAEQPENQCATLVWRKKPFGIVFHNDPEWLNSDTPHATKRFIRMRLSLKANGWRERCGIFAKLESPLIKPEGHAAKVIE